MENDIEGSLLVSPYKCARPCPGRGPRRGSCPNLIRGHEVCPECQVYEKAAAKEYDQQRGSSRQRGYDTQWEKVRDFKASHDPLCEECLKQGYPDRALDVVHHIKPIETHPELRLVMDNLMSLCTAHHEEIHKGERWGK